MIHLGWCRIIYLIQQKNVCTIRSVADTRILNRSAIYYLKSVGQYFFIQCFKVH